MWKLILAIGLVVGVSVPSHAQAVVYDPAVMVNSAEASPP